MSFLCNFCFFFLFYVMNFNLKSETFILIIHSCKIVPNQPILSPYIDYSLFFNFCSRQINIFLCLESYANLSEKTFTTNIFVETEKFQVQLHLVRTHMNGRSHKIMGSVKCNIKHRRFRINSKSDKNTQH